MQLRDLARERQFGVRKVGGLNTAMAEVDMNLYAPEMLGKLPTTENYQTALNALWDTGFICPNFLFLLDSESKSDCFRYYDDGRMRVVSRYRAPDQYRMGHDFRGEKKTVLWNR